MQHMLKCDTLKKISTKLWAFLHFSFSISMGLPGARGPLASALLLLNYNKTWPVQNLKGSIDITLFEWEPELAPVKLGACHCDLWNNWRTLQPFINEHQYNCFGVKTFLDIITQICEGLIVRKIYYHIVFWKIKALTNFSEVHKVWRSLFAQFPVKSRSYTSLKQCFLHCITEEISKWLWLLNTPLFIIDSKV